MSELARPLNRNIKLLYGVSFDQFMIVTSLSTLRVSFFGISDRSESRSTK